MASETGATKEQVERALPDVLRIIWGVEDTRDWGSIMPVRARAAISSVVRPDERIVLADDLDTVCEAGDHYIGYLRDGGLTAEADALSAIVDRLRAAIGTPTAPSVVNKSDEVPIFDHVPDRYPDHPRFIVLNPIGEEFNQKTGAMQSEWRALYFGAPESAPTVDIGIGKMAGIDFYVAKSVEQSRSAATQEARRLLLNTPTVPACPRCGKDVYTSIKDDTHACVDPNCAWTDSPVCPRCGERTVESPRTGRTCVDDACGWRERE